jgi:hypothetical protein
VNGISSKPRKTSEERPSFLKKRSKRLLILRKNIDAGLGRIGRERRRIKSFLVLFFKKELLPFFLRASDSCENLLVIVL